MSQTIQNSEKRKLKKKKFISNSDYKNCQKKEKIFIEKENKFEYEKLQLIAQLQESKHQRQISPNKQKKYQKFLLKSEIIENQQFPNEFHSKLERLFSDRLQELGQKQQEISDKMQQLQIEQEKSDQRQLNIQQEEKQLQLKRNQLFKSYDILTEKIYQNERQEQNLLNKKRQLQQQEIKLMQAIEQRYKELDSKKQESLQEIYNQKQQIQQIFDNQELGNIQKIEQTQKLNLQKIYEKVILIIEQTYQEISRLNNIIYQNKTYISQQDLDKQYKTNNLQQSITDAIDLVFSLDYKTQQSKKQNKEIMINSDQWIKLEDSDNSDGLQDHAEPFGSKNQTLDYLNQAIILKKEDLDSYLKSASLQMESIQREQLDNDIDERQYQAVLK